MKLKKRILSLLLCGAMLFSLCSQSVLAEENGQAGGVTIGTSGLCEHHPEHNADCGYTEGTAGTPCVHEHTVDCYEEVTNCVHEHDEDCYPEESVSGNEATPSGAQKREPENCPHICDEESGCITKELNCQHEHDDECGYSPATAGTPCGYVCELCGSEDSEKLATPSNAEAVTVASVQAMIDGLPNAEEITEDNAEEVKAQLEAIDEAKEKLSDEEIDELDMTRYAEAAAALGALAAPMLLANDSPDEQFSLKPGDTYYFDLSGANIPGTANGSLPDNTLHYVPFTYAGTVDAYKLTSATATTEEYAQQNKYPHSLFVADYAVTHTISWGGLNDEGLIFGKNYASGGVDYTLRAPSVGSISTGSGDSQRGVPQSNEWDTMLNKNSGYIQNWNKMYSWGQDTSSAAESFRAYRGYNSARFWYYTSSSFRNVYLGFRPVLEVLNPGTLGSDGLKVVTLDLGGGKLGNSSEDIQIIVKTGSEFTAPASDGLTRPDGNTGSYFMWLGSDGKLYAPGANVPAEVTKLTAQFALSEQFSLKPGDTYYFDLSGANIPGTANGSLPDNTLHYVPFTYAGTVDAYKLTSEMETTEEYAQQNKYSHSLFVADYAVTHKVNWNNLDTASLIFGKNYASGGVDYTLRAPSCGSGFTGSDDSERGTPQSNEWDAVLDKNSGYVKNWNDIYSWGQDTSSYESSFRAVRGYNSARNGDIDNATGSGPNLGFRPVLEVLNPDELGSDGLKAVTLDLGGGKLGGSSDAIHIIVKTGSEFTAPASDGMTRPDENTDSYFMWLGSNGKLYAPGDSVPADVTKLTAQFALSEQFFLTPGGRYYFDLSAMNIPGTANGGNSDGAVSLPDTSLHYVPFTYVGTIEAYKLTSATATTEEYAQQNKYPHSLFVADYAVTHTISWGGLNDEGLIFGKNYASGGVDYTLRAPSVGSISTGSGDSQRGVPQSNEWDTMLNKNSGYIQNWNKMYSWGQDTSSAAESFRAYRGYNSARFWYYTSSSFRNVYLGFRPVLEVLNPGTLGSDGLKVVTLDLGGGKLGNSSEDIQIIVKTGSEFTAPASDGLTRPDGDAGSFFMWLGSNGKFYAPGDSVPAEVTKLTAQWTAPTYAVTLNTNGGTINSGNVTSYTYGVGATLPTAGDMTYTGHTFVGWYDNENLTGSPVTAIGGTETGNKEYWAKWEANTYTVTLNTNGGTINSGNVTGYTYGVGATLPTADDMTYTGYTFKGWYDNENLTGSPVTAIGGTETGNKEYWAKWEANAYTVTLNTNGGTINSGNVTEYTYGVGATLPTAGDMTYTGHTFVGWYDNENLTGSPVTAIGGTEMGNKEYWAKWEANTYTVTFYPNGGSVNPVAATTDSSGKLSSLPTPTRGGNYRFDGWYTEQTGGIKVTLNQVYTADTTLYAYWIYTSGSSSSEDRDDPSGNAFITDRPNKDNPTTPTTAKSNPVKVDSKGNAVITRSIVADVISVAQSDSIKHGNTKNGIAVVVPVEISKALAGVQITLKADALDKLVSSGVKRFTIDTDSMADFGFMLDTLKELNRQTTGDLILKMKKTAVTSQEAETAIGNRPVYDITLWEVKNGKETAVNLSGKTVSIAIPYTPAKNEKPGNLYAVYVDENGNVQWISKSSYNMDQKAVIFVAEHFSIYGIGYKNQIPAFTDVNNHWAKDNMLFVVSRGLLSGTSATTFSPNTGMTRGMFVTALGRLAGVDPTDYQASMFTDVKEDAYYAPYVNWAAKTGVVSGTTDTTFAPDTNISREQMAVIMKNYATKLGYTIPKTLEVVNFADSAGISSWAKEAVKSMQQAGILAGKTNNCFDPAGTATRAEVATVLRRFVEIVIDPQTANGWVQNDSGEWSYYKNGDLVKGWLSNDQKWYWLDKNTGKMFSGGWNQIDGKQYYFYADGSMAVNTTVDGKTIGADGARK